MYVFSNWVGTPTNNVSLPYTTKRIVKIVKILINNNNKYSINKTMMIWTHRKNHANRNTRVDD